MIELIYECSKCERRYYCDAGFFARLDCCKEGYPVKIIGWRKKLAVKGGDKKDE